MTLYHQVVAILFLLWFLVWVTVCLGWEGGTGNWEGTFSRYNKPKGAFPAWRPWRPTGDPPPQDDGPCPKAPKPAPRKPELVD